MLGGKLKEISDTKPLIALHVIDNRKITEARKRTVTISPPPSVLMKVLSSAMTVSTPISQFVLSIDLVLDGFYLNFPIKCPNSWFEVGLLIQASKIKCKNKKKFPITCVNVCALLLQNKDLSGGGMEDTVIDLQVSVSVGFSTHFQNIALTMAGSLFVSLQKGLRAWRACSTSVWL